jgi:hypothetical protein
MIYLRKGSILHGVTIIDDKLDSRPLGVKRDIVFQDISLRARFASWVYRLIMGNAPTCIVSVRSDKNVIDSVEVK